MTQKLSPSGPECQCDGYCKGRRYSCPRCKRFVLWCFGTADEFADVCDDCFTDLKKLESQSLLTEDRWFTSIMQLPLKRSERRDHS